MKTAFILSLLSLWFSLNTNAQNTIEGWVTDKETRQPLEAATVTLQQGQSGTVLNYALTDADGRFRMKSSSTTGMIISVLYMGYKKISLPAVDGKPMNLALEQDAILLKEVQIRPGRIWGRQDTLKYDLTKFASSKDRNVSDVLKKLPGINVEENGTIKYNGKAISNFYVEGMDVSGGRYNQINQNLKADAVQSAEVIENHQPIKSLRNKVFTDDVALNLKLKPSVRSQWIKTAIVGGGYGDEALYDASFNALQLSRDKQTIYNYKVNNTGQDRMSEQQQLAIGNSFDRVSDNGAPSFLSLPGLSMPLSQKRLLFNDTHVVSANRLFRLNDDKQLRFQLGYVHDRTTQQSGHNETYYFAQDTVRTENNLDYHLRTDRLNGELNYENNTASGYTRNNLAFTSAWKEGLSYITGDENMTQRIKHAQFEVKNFFNRLYTQETYTWGIHSFVRYSYLPVSLCIGLEDEKMDVSNAYTDNSLYWMKKKNGVTYQLTTGFRGELSSVKDEECYSANKYAIYATPRLEWERNDFQVTATGVAQWSHLPDQSYGSFYVNPLLYVRYRFTPRWRISLSGGLNKSEGNLSDVYPNLYRLDYRTFVQNSGIVPQSTNQSYSFYTEYRNTIKEFFWTSSIAYNRTHRNLMAEQNYKDGYFLLSSSERKNTSYAYTLNSVLSKGVYDWHLKTSFELTLNRSEGEQLNQGLVQTYRYDYLQMEPKIVWSPSSLIEAEYKAMFSCGASKIGKDTHLDPLWNISQRLTVSLGFNDMDIQLSGEHFYNDLSNVQHLNTWLADISLIHKTGKWRFVGNISNLFNKKEYSYTIYSAVQSNTSWVRLRPREFLLSAQYQW